MALATGTSLDLVIPSEVRLVDLVHEVAEKIARLAGFDEDEALNVGLALREAVINAVVHGNGQDPGLDVRIKLAVNGDGLEARVRDHGRGFDPEANPDPTADSNIMNTSGRGLLLIRAFVDEVRFDRSDDGMQITLTKRIQREPEQA